MAMAPATATLKPTIAAKDLVDSRIGLPPETHILSLSLQAGALYRSQYLENHNHGFI
jgi:hypothetical protein